jgi:hypothetical protein
MTRISSKEELQRKLHRPRPALLILRGNRTKALVERLCRLSKSGVAQRRIDITEDGMVEDIECFRTELQIQALIQPEVAPDSHIDLGRCEPSKVVSGHGAIRGLRCQPPAYWEP